MEHNQKQVKKVCPLRSKKVNENRDKIFRISNGGKATVEKILKSEESSIVTPKVQDCEGNIQRFE